MKVKANTSFAHGIYVMHKNEEMEIPDGIASDLLKGGFIEELKVKKADDAENKKAPAVANKKAAEPENKSKSK